MMSWRLRISIVQAIVGFVWIAWSFAIWQRLGGRPPSWSTAVASALTLAIIVTSVISERRRHATPATQSTWNARGKYGLILLCEMAGVLIVLATCSRVGRQDLILPLISAIVGLHFVGLHRAYRALQLPMATRFLVTGVIMTVFALLTLLLPPRTRQPVIGIGMALLLWATVLLRSVAGVQ